MRPAEQTHAPFWHDMPALHVVVPQATSGPASLLPVPPLELLEVVVSAPPSPSLPA